MIGAIAGDVVGSAFEWRNVKTTDFDLFSHGSRFTDDTVLTVAVADCILSGKEYARAFKDYGRMFPDAGYGGMFWHWLHADSLLPYNSFGNGSAMRVSPVGFAFGTLEEVMEEAKRSAEVTHNHPEGIKGAQAVASAIFLARQGATKQRIRTFIEGTFDYDLSRTLNDIRPLYRFDETCQGSVPEAIIAFLESDGYEDAIRRGVSIGGDSDTIACMTGGIAQAYFKHIPDCILRKVRELLDPRLLKIVDLFDERYVG